VPQIVDLLDDREWKQVDREFRRGMGFRDLG
jgi:hypothetical protein